jgi:hypothetical protein
VTGNWKLTDRPTQIDSKKVIRSWKGDKDGAKRNKKRSYLPYSKSDYRMEAQQSGNQYMAEA